MGNNIAIWKIQSGPQTAPQRLAHFDHEPISLDEAAREFPGGAYTTLRTYQHNRALLLVNHFDRLEETASLAGKPVQIDRPRLREALRNALSQHSAQDVRVRITLDLEKEVGVIYLMLEPLHVPAASDYQHGVAAITYPLQRRNPKAKLTSFIETASQVRQTLPDGVNEAVMVGEEGRLLEGLSSNFFAVFNGVVWTADDGVLSGITRSIVLEVIQQYQIPLRLEGLPALQLAQIGEAFITSASRAVLPVTTIDRRPVANGKPGPMTQKLAGGYQQAVERMLELI